MHARKQSQVCSIKVHVANLFVVASENGRRLEGYHGVHKCCLKLTSDQVLIFD